MKKSPRLSLTNPLFWSWTNLSLALFIILWGAWVRLSKSGAGCGDHWPLCKGQVIPDAQNLKTLIEFTHRATSGVFGITIIMLLTSLLIHFRKGHPARKTAWTSAFFTLTEALVGALLVKRNLVVDNMSLERFLVGGLHLLNTLCLMASLTLCLYWSKHKNTSPQRVKLKNPNVFYSIATTFFATSFLGAMVALGHGQYPETSLWAGFLKDFDPNSPLYIRLRFFHPLLATFLTWALYIWGTKKKSLLLQGMTLINFGFGFINLSLLTPVWGSLVHLFLVNMLWIIFVYLR